MSTPGLIIGAAATATAIALAGAGVALNARFQQTNDRRATQTLVNDAQKKTNARITKATADNREAIRTVLCLAESQLAHATNITAEGRAQAIAFYSKALFLIHAKPCVPVPA